MFDNLKIGNKMLLLSGTILLLLLITLAWGTFGLTTTVENGIQVSAGNQLRSELQGLENAHLKWAHQVRDFLVDPNITELTVKLDHTTCALGKWYYGEDRRHAEAVLPQIKADLQALEEPHRLLHASGQNIKNVYDPLNPAAANAIYAAESAPNLQKIGKLMNSMTETSRQNIMSDSEMIATAKTTRSGIITLGIVALLIGFVLAVLISRSLTAPMKKAVAMLTELDKGHLGNRLAMNRNDEIGQMAATMDQFADSLQNEIVDSLQRLASGDLTFDVQPRDAQDVVRGSLKKLGEDLNQIMSRTLIASEQIAAGSFQVSDSAQSLSQGATESAASLEEISSSMNEIGSQTNQSAESAKQANQLAAAAAAAAATGSKHMTDMITAMGEINEASQNISKIIKVIDEIAFQTNLLALNAAVEAARAGQHGKGFAVVAEEVRNLAARSAKAAGETASLIEGSVGKTSNGTQIAKLTATSLEEIVAAVTKVTNLVAEIAAASSEQAQGVAQINIGLQQIDQVIQTNTANSEESAATSEELSSQAAELKGQLSYFKLKSGGFSSTALHRAPQLSYPVSTQKDGWGNTAAVQPSGNSFVIQWDNRLNTGIALVDKQHRKLVELMNQLFQCMKDGGDRMLLGSIIDELVSYTVTHFRAEEDIMQRTHYPDLENHKKIHQEFVTKVGAALSKLKNGERLAPADIYKFLKDWLINHIEKQDRDGYAPHAKARS